MNEIDSELINLKKNLSSINGAYAEVDKTLKFKWKEIKKLDMLEKDLNKLKYLNDLPSMFKAAIFQFENKKEGIEAFNEPIKYFEEYSDVLTHYKKTVNIRLLLMQLLELYDKFVFRN